MYPYARPYTRTRSTVPTQHAHGVRTAVPVGVSGKVHILASVQRQLVHSLTESSAATSQNSIDQLSLYLKQPLCARQNGFSDTKRKLIPDTGRLTPGFEQLIHSSW